MNIAVVDCSKNKGNDDNFLMGELEAVFSQIGIMQSKF